MEKKSLFLSPHDDDHALYGAFTCIREKPVVLVLFDSYIQPMRGEVGCDAETRSNETEESCKILGCDVIRAGISDFEAIEEDVDKFFEGHTLNEFYDVVYAPAQQFGNGHHDIVSRAAVRHFGDKVIFYTTYNKTELYTEGETPVDPTPEEVELKLKSMDCYTSQLNLPSTSPHFAAVAGKPEWLGFYPSVYLGAGKDRKPGWVHLDRHRFNGLDIFADVTKGLPFEDLSVGRIFSQDFLEHLPAESKIDVMNEIWRVLKPGGTMEHIIPNAGSANDFGSPTHLSHWSLQQFEHFDVNSYRYEKDREYEGFKGGFEKIFANLSDDAQTIHVFYKAIK